MAYRSETTATILRDLNQRLFLPAFQREFVWDQDQVIDLFDSIMRGYPIGSFLFWELNDANKENWEIYEFFRRYDRRKHNERAIVHGIHGLALVLDGQQRLTSLLIGLKGSYIAKIKYRRWNDPSAWVEQHLYLDLSKDPRVSEDDNEIGVYYEFDFFENEPKAVGGQYWYKVGHILDFDNADAFQDHVEDIIEKLPDSITKGQSRVARQNLQRLHEAVWKDDTIAFYTEHDQSYDRVLDIFVRANEGGTKLTKSDLLLAMITSKWAGTNARDEIYGFVDHLNDSLTRSNALDKDFVMKTCLVLSDLPVQYKVDNFNNQNLAIIEREWPRIKESTADGVDLVNRFGIDRDTLTSQNALIPIIYYLFRQGGLKLNTHSASDVQNSTAIRKWLLMGLLNNVFGGSSDTLLTEIRKVISDGATRGEPDFPVEAINKRLAAMNRSAGFNDDAIRSFLDISYGTRDAFFALSLLYDEKNWGVIPHHKDHIFPQSMFSPTKMRQAGIPEHQWEEYWELRDLVGNLQLLIGPENEEKSNKSFDAWVTTRDRNYRKIHLIPDDDRLFDFGRFPDFVAERERLIEERLKQQF